MEFLMPSPVSKTAQYVIGIDLGTTHSVLSFKSIDDYQASASVFHVDQLIGPGEVSRKPLLPSFRYHFNDNEIATTDCVLPWQSTRFDGEIANVIVGQWARDLGTKTKGRLVSSAKSWLSHPSIDAQAAILPWAVEDNIQKVSPVIASASY
ncbi:MAG: molecular chaperone DnaK (HSP70), partial [Moritella dasanensis]